MDQRDEVVSISDLVKQDMDRQKCIIECYETIKNHHDKFKIKVDDPALANILRQIIERYERDENAND